MNRSALAIPALALCVFFATPTLAQTIPAGGATAQDIQGWLTAQGLDAAARTDAASPTVMSGANGVSWDVIGFDCQAERCGSWQFSAAFRADALQAGAVERWNAQRRYLKAFEATLDNQAVAVVQYDVLLVPGSTWEGLTAHMNLFAGTVPLFAIEIGAAQAPGG